MGTAKLFTFLICLLHLRSYAQQNCLLASNGSRSLPNFMRPGGGKEPRFKVWPLQAIITSYRFNCCGVVTEWRAFVEKSGGGHAMAYRISFQVWRPNSPLPVSTDGCYSMTGVNHFSPILLADHRSADEGIVTGTVPESERIEVQPGDVVGFYLENSKNDDDGIQFARDADNDPDYTSEAVWYATDTIDSGLTGCQPVGSGRTLSSSTNRAPLITVSILSSECPVTSSTPSPTPSLTSSPGHSSTPSPGHSSTPSPVVHSSTPSPGHSSTPSPVVHSSTPSPDLTPTFSTTDGTQLTPSDPPRITSNDSSGLIAGFVVALLVVMVIAVLAIVIIVVLMRRRQNKSGSINNTALSNPNYEEATSVKRREPERKSMATNNDDSSYQTFDGDYDYQGVPAAALDYTLPTPSPTVKYNPKTDEVKLSTTKSELAYHTQGPGVENQYDYCGTGPTNQTLEPNYTGKLESPVLYEDPTLPKFRTSIQNGDPFESEGIYVPTLAQRQTSGAHSKFQNDSNPYNTLQFFVDDDIYWAPADTASDLYQQLASKKYREIPRNQITMLEQLGSGQFGLVCKGLWSISDNTLQLAVKTLKPNAPEDDKVKFLQEAAIMGQFLHPNVVKLYGVVTVGEPVMICLEILSNGDLRDYLRSIDMSSTTKMASQDLQLLFLRFAKEIATGMDYLSKKAFVHRDLAARNVLVNDALTCKIGDFGMARDLMDDTYYTSQGGKIPVKWTAPEALLYKKYSTDSDVWSYGMVLFEIWSVGQKPFSMLTHNEVLRLIQSGHCQCPPPGCPREIYRLMVDCWNPEHQYRPKFGVICSKLQAPPIKLLYWSSEDSKVSKEASVLGASLEEGFNLYGDLQEKYQDYECI